MKIGDKVELPCGTCGLVTCSHNHETGCVTEIGRRFVLVELDKPKKYCPKFVKYSANRLRVT